ncbi:sulfurtransferase [Chitinimonas sp. PSY-7]|uniref:rhodanese-like domain-containing protein n=1 Tax=Chitinimonas sp. PSY-7 TaxID=3459088 RepID=UPI00403FF9E1
MSPLIQASELAKQLGRADLVLIDCRHELAQPEAGKQAYEQGHLPGAVFAHLDQDLSGPKTGRNGRHPLPDPLQLAVKLAALGIRTGCHVVAYDAQGGMFAARLWWLLRWLGFESVQVLDGGVNAWLAAGGQLDANPPNITVGTFEAKPQNAKIVNADTVLDNLDRQEFVVIDARAPGRFAGEGETLDPIAGHIPGAMNRFFQLNLQADGRFKPAETLRSEWQVFLDGRDVHDTVQQCGSGVTACHNLLALAVAGMPGSRLYPGSWSEWCSEPGRPVARGAA